MGYTNLTISGSNIRSLAPLSDMQPFNGYLSIRNTQLETLQGLVLAESLLSADISSNRLLTDLASFESVTTIENNLTINYNNVLAGLDGFANLSSVDRIFIFSNSELQNLEGLSNLEQINVVSISRNQNLADCCGILTILRDKIEEVSFSIGDNLPGCSNRQDFFSSCDIEGCFDSHILLRTQDELDNFSAVYGDCTEIDYLEISGADIINLEGLHDFVSINSVRINNTSLTGLDGLSISENLASLRLENNSLLTDLSAISNLVSIEDQLTIFRNDRLQNVDAFENLGRVGSLNIYQNDQLQNINGFEGIEELSGRIQIQSNRELSACCSLSPHFEEKLDRLYNLSISDNQGDCEELHIVLNQCGIEGCFINNILLETQEEVDNFKQNYGSCTTIDRLTINGIGITNLNQLDEIEEISNLRIENTSIVNLNTVPITESTAYVYISSNDLLVGLEVFDGLRNLSRVEIRNNASLTHIDDLRRLQNIDQLSITNNIRLADVDGLLNLRTFNRLDLSNNASLSECCSVVRSFEDSVADKNITIRNNDDGCMDLPDLLATCGFEGCFADQITINQQSQIDNFVTEFGNCTSLERLYINGANITNLDGLSILRNIETDLRIENTSLVSLSGLDSTLFSGSITLHNNPLLTDVEVLERVDVNIRYLIIQNNITLSSCCILGDLLEEHPNAYNFVVQGNADGCAGIGDILNSCGIDACVAPDVLRIRSQSDIDEVESRYGNCTSFRELNITGSDITNFDGLAGIQEITESVSIWESSFESLEGLEHLNLDSIISLNVTGTNRLRSLDGLTLPQTIDRVTIGNLPDLTDLRNLRTVKYVIDFNLSDLDLIDDLQGLQNLSRIQSLSIYSMPQIKHLDELSNIIEIRNLNIYRNNKLENLNGLVNARNLEQISVNSNDSLSLCCTLLPHFDPAESHRFNFYSNAPGCEDSRDVLNSCEYDGCFGNNIVIESQEDVNNIKSNYGNCSEIENLTIQGGSISNLDSLIHIDKVSNSLTIYNSALISLEGLTNIDFSDLNRLSIYNNSSLLSFDGLESLGLISEFLIIENNLSIQNLNGFQNLISVGRLRITNNRNLESLNGLEGLRDVNQINININPNLKDIEALSKLANVTNFYINDNTSLASCCVSLTNTMGQAHNLYGLYNNSDGCNTLQEIQTSCSLGDCNNGDIILTNQEEVDNYAANNPGCQSILSLTISGEGITNLDSLIHIESISQSLTITETSLVDLEVLSHLDLRAATEFRFIDNQELNAITSLSLGETIDTMIVEGNPSIISVGSQNFSRNINFVQINNNESLSDIPFFGSIIDGADQIIIVNNENLEECCGLFDLIEEAEVRSLTLENNGSSCNNTQTIIELCGHCEEHHIRLNSQAEVDSYRSRYPSCTEIGELDIDGEDITNLDSLYYLQSVDIHNLSIKNTSLTNLEGISHIEVDVDYVEIINNPLLESIDLPNLSVRDDINIIDNISLLDLDGIGYAGSAQFLIISGNSSLMNLDGLGRLGNVMDLVIANNESLVDISGIRGMLADRIDLTVTIQDNGSLSDCCILEEYFEFEHPHEEIRFEISGNGVGCENLEAITNSCVNITCGTIALSLNTQAQVDSFPINYPNCISFNTLRIEGEDITSLDSLYRIEDVYGDFTLRNTSVSSIGELTIGESLNNFYIVNNPNLTSLLMPLKIKSINGRAIIQNNAALISLDGFAALESIGLLTIDDNDLIQNLEYFSNLNSIIGFNVTNNRSLSDCCLLENILATGINRSRITIDNNASGCTNLLEVNENCFCPEIDLTFTSQAQIDSFSIKYPNCNQVRNLSIEGIDINNVENLSNIDLVNGRLDIEGTSLESIDGINIGASLNSLYIFNNDHLVDLDALSNLRETESRIVIGKNNSLTTLNGLRSLRDRGGELGIQENSSLVDISGLAKLSSLEGFFLEDNLLLSACCFIDQKVTEGVDTTNIIIRGNASGCMDLMDISETCNIVSPCTSEEIRLSSQRAVDEFVATYGACTNIDRLYLTGGDISNLDGISGLLKINERLTIRGTRLIDLSEFRGVDLSTIIQFDVLENYRIESLEGVNLSSHVDKVVVSNNFNLTDIYALEQIETYNYLEIKNNNSLAECCPVLVAFENRGEARMFIENNAYGCKDVPDAFASCDSVSNFDCLNVRLRNQEEVDSFSINYAGCESLRLLQIRGDDITNIDSLSTIKSIEIELLINETNISNVDGLGNAVIHDLENISITDNNSLSSLEGLNVSGNVVHINIYDNNVLQNLEGLEAVEQIDGLSIFFNDELSSLGGLTSLDSIGGLEIVRNSSLADIGELQKVTIGEIRGIVLNESLMDCCSILPLGEDENIRDNGIGCRSVEEILNVCDEAPCDITDLVLTTQQEVDVFPTTYSSCTTLGSLTISGMDISRLDSLYTIRRVDGPINISNTSIDYIEGLMDVEFATDITIENNQLLRSIRGFENINSLSGTLTIRNNDALEDNSGVNFFDHIGAVVIEDNDSLTFIDSFDVLASIGSFTLNNNSTLSACCMVEQIISLGVTPGNIIISNNANGCSSYDDVIESCDISNDPELRSCDLSRITLRSQLEVDNFSANYDGCNEVEELVIRGRDVENLDGLATLRSITSRIEIEETSLMDLSGLSHVEMSNIITLEIRDNEGLVNLEGVTVSSVMDRVIVSNNHQLVDIESLSSLRIYSYFEVFGNESLSLCCAIIPALDKGPDARLVVRSNAAGCNRSSEIIQGCDDIEPIDCTQFVLNGQEEVDNFVTDYPSCSSVQELTINGQDITNLDGLSNLESVTAWLHIDDTSLADLSGVSDVSFSSDDLIVIVSNNDDLMSLAGIDISGGNATFELDNNDALVDLTSLSTIESLAIFGAYNNSSLTTLAGLEVVQFIESLLISDNEILTDISAIENINVQTGGFIGNSSLTNCCILSTLENAEVNDNGLGCNSLEEIEDTCTQNNVCGRVALKSQEEVDNFVVDYPDCQIVAELFISGLDIENLTGIASLVSVTETLLIDGTSIGDLSALQTVDLSQLSELELTENQVINNLSGLNIPAQMERVIVSDNPLLISIENLEPLRTYEYLEIFGNSSLSMCCPIVAALSHDDGRMVVRNNDNGCNRPRDIKDGCDGIVVVDCSTIRLESQEEVDNFSQTYPGCVSLEFLEIVGTDITNLDGLASIENVTVSLSVNSTSLTNLEGLSAITFQPGELIIGIVDNDNLVSLDGLNLTGRVNTIEIDDNDALVDLSALASLDELDMFGLLDNRSITSLLGLEGIVSITEIFLDNNESLTNISALENVDVSTAIIFSNIALSECCILSTINEVDLRDNGVGCSSIDEVESVCNGSNSDCPFSVELSSQSDVDNFILDYPNCTDLFELFIEGEDINNLDGLSSINSISESLVIDGTLLSDLSGLQDINLGGLQRLQIVENQSIENLVGLNIGGQIERVIVASNAILDNIENLEPLRTYEYLEVFGNPLLSACCSLVPALEYEAGRMVVRSNNTGCNRPSVIIEDCEVSAGVDCDEITLGSQKEVDDFESIYAECNSTTSLRIDGADITNLNGLTSLLKISHSLYIGDTQLSDLDGLNQVELESLNVVTIYNNDLLSSLGDKITIDTAVEVNISENDLLDTGSENQKDTINKNRFKVFPNPFANRIIISKPMDINIAKVKLYDIRGALIYSDDFIGTKKIIDTEILKSGIYLVRIEGAEFVQTIKVVKK